MVNARTRRPKRIICDKDGDGYMDDQDLIDLQKEVFDQDLQKTHITALK